MGLANRQINCLLLQCEELFVKYMGKKVLKKQSKMSLVFCIGESQKGTSRLGFKV